MSGGLPPTFAQKPSIKQAPGGAKIIFSCKLQADPQPNVLWFHDDEPVSHGGRYNIYVTPEDKNICLVGLEITGIAKEDGGKYRVNAKNDLGETNATLNLNFGGKAPPPRGTIKPQFQGKPAIKQEGGVLRMECLLKCKPASKITWFHGTDVVTETDRLTITATAQDNDVYKLILAITEPKAEDGGSYRCNAVNDAGESNANIALNFAAPPQPEGIAPNFVAKPKIIPSADGSMVTLQCQAKCKPAPTVVWRCDGNEVAASARFVMTVLPQDGDIFVIQLEIKNPEAGDGGQYKCTLKNKYGESNANLALNFAGETKKGQAPTFVQKPKIIPKDGGKLIIMEVALKADPAPGVIWFHNGTPVQLGNRLSTITRQDGDVYTVHLEIKDPTADDSGTYKCNVKNEAGENNANLTLNIAGEKKPEGTKPTFTSKPKISQDDTGRNVTVDCVLKAKPPPTITWYKDNAVLVENRRVRSHITQDGENYTLRLTISNVIASDTGKYKANAKNELGETNANINLNFEGAPKEPPPVFDTEPIIRQRRKGRTLIIECELLSQTEPRQINWYHGTRMIQVDSRHKTNIIKHPKGEGYILSLELIDVEKSDSGMYKCVVKNEYGQADTSTNVNVEEPQEPDPEEPEEEKTEIKIDDKVKPSFATKLRPQSGKAGDSINFMVSIKGNPEKVTWYRNGVAVRPSKNYKVSQNGEVYRMSIQEASPSDSGEWKCEATNKKGTESTTAKLNIEEEKKDEEPEIIEKDEEEGAAEHDEEEEEVSPGADKTKKKKVPTATLR